MNLQDFLELVQLCEINGIITLSELKQYKTINGIKTNADLLEKLRRN
jgi:hypothetical protein